MEVQKVAHLVLAAMELARSEATTTLLGIAVTSFRELFCTKPPDIIASKGAIQIGGEKRWY